MPSRTGVNVKPEIYAALAEHPRIVGIKEANGDISAAAKTIAACGDRCSVYSGNDDQTLAFAAIGAKGVISVAANLIPAEMHRLCASVRNNDMAAARDLNEKFLKLTALLFCEVNPIPVKAAIEMMFNRPQPLRLPLTGLTKANRGKLLAEMKRLSLAE